ncbi:unnamed protein product [Urochloa humidicola]
MDPDEDERFLMEQIAHGLKMANITNDVDACEADSYLNIAAGDDENSEQDGTDEGNDDANVPTDSGEPSGSSGQPKET